MNSCGKVIKKTKKMQENEKNKNILTEKSYIFYTS